jgi:hypothetical protein
VTDPVALCATAVARWHAAWLTALGIPWKTDADAWRALAPPHFIYFGAITLRPDAPPRSVVAAPGSVCDNWQTLDLEPYGYRIYRQEPWFLRPPQPLAADVPRELDVVRVHDEDELAEFELVSVRGFEDETATVARGTMHPPAALEDAAMAIFLGRVHGEAVAAAMGYRTEDAVGVFGVTTVASARRRGYGRALTCAAMLPETGLPAVLAPSKEGESMYRKLGFGRVGALSIWTKAGPGR